MPSFGKTSRSRLATLDPRLQKVLNRAIQTYDFTVVCGHRDEAAQNDAFSRGMSKVQWPDSKHNTTPSIAVDVAPWVNGGIDWRDTNSFCRLAGIIEQCAFEEGVKIRWGGDWDMDGGSRDQSFMDIGHIELVE